MAFSASVHRAVRVFHFRRTLARHPQGRHTDSRESIHGADRSHDLVVVADTTFDLKEIVRRRIPLVCRTNNIPGIS